MTDYMLDTNMASTMADDPRGAVYRRIRQVGAGRVAVSSIVAGELRYGGLKRGSPRLSSSLERILDLVAVEPVTETVARDYADIRSELMRRGAIIGPNDLWIAAHAVALDRVLVTANTGEFGRVRKLRLENWLDA